MPEFEYWAADAGGRKSRGRMGAANRAEALGELRARGLYPLAVVEKRASASHPGWRRPRRADVLAFTQQMATLVNAGLQLDRALATLEELAGEGQFGSVVTAIRQDVQGGASFSAALERHPRLFDQVYVNMVRAGETGGVLPLVLRRLALAIEEERELRSFILGALLYPAVVAMASLGAIAVLMVFVVPSFERIFAQMDLTLPAITRGTIILSRFIVRHGLWLAGAGVLAAAAFGRWAGSAKGRRTLDGIYLRLPILGDFNTKLNTARLTRTMALLAEAGIPILQSLAVAKETIRNTVIHEALERAGREIREGGGVARRLAAQGILPAAAIQMIAVGEETGELAGMLQQVAKGYDGEVRRAIRSLLALLEPVLILGLTAVTILIALSILLPVVAMSAEL